MGGLKGITLIEVLLAVAIAATTIGVAVPIVAGALDDMRAAMAARYLEGRIMGARMHAVKRSSRIALRFERSGTDYQFAEYLDGNDNGVRAAEITAGVDTELAARQLLSDVFPGIALGLLPNVPDVDGVRSASATDGVRIGTSRILTLSPDGTATSGTLYVHGTRRQYAVRVFGATGRTRVLRFEPGQRGWQVR